VNAVVAAFLEAVLRGRHVQHGRAIPVKEVGTMKVECEEVSKI